MRIKIQGEGSVEVERKDLMKMIKENKSFILANFKDDNAGEGLENIEEMEGLVLVFDAHEYVIPLHKFVENFKNTYGVYPSVMYQHYDMQGQDTSKFTAIYEFDKPISLEQYEKLYEALYETYAGYLEEGRQANSLVFGTSKAKKIFGCSDRHRRVMTEELIKRIIANKRTPEEVARIEAIKHKKEDDVIKKVNTAKIENADVIEVLVTKKTDDSLKNLVKEIKNDNIQKINENEKKDETVKAKEDNSKLIAALKVKYNQLLQRVKHADIFLKKATDEEIEANKENIRILKMNVKRVLDKLEELGYIVTIEEKEKGFAAGGEA